MTTAYRDAVAYLYGLQKHGIKLGLDTIEALLDRLGRPQAACPSLHIGGTNGKGSTAAMAASILQAAGYRVGLYTSPHLVDYRERIRIDGRMCEEEAVVELVRAVRAAAGADLAPTFFEFNTAMAFRAFAEAGVDVAVVEVGMGGRFDATNVLRPLASAIVTVALDHQDQLGSTIAAIAGEKAGIIKDRTPIVTGRLDVHAEAVIDRVAAERQAPRVRLGREFRITRLGAAGGTYEGFGRTISGLSLQLAGVHQWDNAACALALVEAASGRGFSVSDAAMRDGLRSVRWEGRLEALERDPLILVDGAHNPAAAEVVARYLTEFKERQPSSRIHLIVGMMRDKDMAGVLGRLAPLADRLTLAHVDLPRAAGCAELRAALPATVGPVETAESVADALDRARRFATPADVICFTGSLMLVGEVKALLSGCQLSPISG